MRTDNIRDFFSDYAAAISYGLQKIDLAQLNAAVELMKLSRQSGGRIFVAGNGGSAAISEHLTCDFSKGTRHGDHALKIHSLSSNLSPITALANDISYEDIFIEQMDLLDFGTNDAIILISSSGNSPNVLRAAEYANSIGATVIGLTGFLGGKLKDLANISIHVPISNYGIAEDCHQAVMHILAQYHLEELKRA